MPDLASDAVTVALVNVGAGEVVLDLPVGDLVPPGERRVDAPRSPAAPNMRLLDNLARVRSGYAELGTQPDTNRVTGLFRAVFDNDSVFTVRMTRDSADSFDGTSYTDITGGTFTGLTDDRYWDLAMVLRSGTNPTSNQLFACDGLNLVKSWDGIGSFVDVVGSPIGGVAVTEFIDRAFIGNVEDGTTNRRQTRVQFSVNGDPTDFLGPGSGFNDLTDDPYPIAKLAVMAGGMVILKGDAEGGSVGRGTPTGNPFTPLRFDTLNPGVGVGLLLRRTFLILSPGVAFFTGHDGFYLWDGLRGLKRIAEGLQRTLIRRINQEFLDAAHAWYKPQTMEIHIAIPTGANETPSEVWVHNLRDNRSYGPYDYADIFTASSTFVNVTGAFQWNAGGNPFTFPGGWPTIPFPTWNDIGGNPGSQSISLGADGGELFNDTDDFSVDDNGAAISGSYITASVRAEGHTVLDPNSGSQRVLSQNDLLTVEDIAVEYASDVEWTPVISISTDDGLTFTTVSGGEVRAAGGGMMERVHVTPQITGSRFMVSINAAANNRFNIHSVYLRLRYAGDERAG